MRIIRDDFARDLPAVSERPRAEPVTVTRDEHDDLVLLPAEEYARLRARGRRLKVGPMDDGMTAASEVAEMSAEFAYLNGELEGWDPDKPE